MKSRQERRKHDRQVRKKVGQLMALSKENAKVSSIKKFKSNFKSIQRIETDLMDLGVLKRPSRFQIFFYRLKAKLFRGFF